MQAHEPRCSQSKQPPLAPAARRVLWFAVWKSFNAFSFIVLLLRVTMWTQTLQRHGTVQTGRHTITESLHEKWNHKSHL